MPLSKKKRESDSETPQETQQEDIQKEEPQRPVYNEMELIGLYPYQNLQYQKDIIKKLENIILILSDQSKMLAKEFGVE